ncbi:SMC-Scp complex subunit ScpB [Fulvivirga sp. RKSG066]|uniref:SMC-Scp complex subunit ScpB n=1 Tax=Fulvivirga aurantia TaxID=2529383 RepID=UPI0012BBE54E|nr:SMC-Scp complex subunit ScpB [Fulvivirga aurantia]MTI20628.1 SMC-Scp complex subunit ScpB [Fulvivirga aurantia]
MDYLQNHIEALIFCSPNPVKVKELQGALSEMFEADVPTEHIEEVLVRIDEKYSADEFSFSLNKTGGGYQFLTKPAYQASIGILLKQRSKRRLSTSALETLSIVAYKQPVTKGEVENIRGVNCDYAVQKLLEKGLLEIKGKSEAIGRPLLYGTTDQFMEYFGINDLKELPTPKDFAQADDNVIGEEGDD